MEALYRNDPYHNFLILKADEKMESSYRYQMLIQNRIKGLLKSTVRTMNNEKFIYYEISPGKSMKSMLEKEKLSYKMLKNMLLCLHACIEEAGRYLLAAEDILLDPSMIFYDSKTEKFEFCYYPDAEKDFMMELNILMQAVLPALEHDNREKIRTAYEIQDMAMKGTHSFFEIMDAIMKEPVDFLPEEVTVNAINDEKTSEKNEGSKKLNLNKKTPDLSKIYIPAHTGMIACGAVLSMFAGIALFRAYQDMEYGILIPLSAAGGLICMFLKRVSQSQNEDLLPEPAGESCGKHWRLESVGSVSAEEIHITRFPFIIGSLEERCDYLVSASDISPMHARFHREEKEIFLEDLNSAEGSSVNAEQLIPFRKRALAAGDHIKFAEKVYILR